MNYEFNGIRFYQTTPKDYCRHSVGHTTILMHKYVWEFYNGKIPTGYEVHHIDGNRANNDISNLQLLTSEEHKKLHAEKLTAEQREWRKRNVVEKAVPKAVEWHKSEEGLAWHREHAKNLDLHKERHLVCLCCGKSFTTHSTRVNKFCSNACKAKYYRQHTEKTELCYPCAVCGKMFMTTNPQAHCCSKSCSAKWRWQNRKGN